jgi:octaprenyl-diphosphate synthase
MTLSARTPQFIAAALKEIQSPVQSQLGDVADEMWRIIAVDVPLVEQVQEHLMRMKGKMFRPTLLLLANAVEERPATRAITLAAVLELIHVATLVHDDSVDHSVLRRGMPTVNATFSHQVAVIMGDFIYSRAVRELVRLGDVEALRVIADASNDMTLGELRQLASYDALRFTESDYERLIASKTASLFQAACEVGAICGAPAWRVPLARFGERLGMAFQVADDLLDYTEAAEMTGKPSGLDLREHKVTLPLIAAMREMPPADLAAVRALFDDPSPGQGAVAETVQLVHRFGGIEYARRRAEEYAREAEAALAGLPDSAARGALADAIGYVVDRRW